MKFKVLILVAVLLAPTAAKADYFFWRHEKSGLAITFPDRWKQQSNQNPDTILTVMGPSRNDQPTCKVDVVPDRRYTIFPAEYGADIQKLAVSRAFWEKYLSRYDKYNLGHVFDGAKLGRWHASYAVAGYNNHSGTVEQARRAVMFASLYRDQLFVIECSALDHAYEAWEADFRGIIKSVDFKKAYHEVPSGDYADFLNEAETFFWAQTGPLGTTAY